MNKAMDAVETVIKGGWFISAIQSKYNINNDRMEFLKKLCSDWLEKNFNIHAEIGSMELLDQEEIDRDLGLIGIRFGFSNKETTEGEAIAFFEEKKLKVMV